MPFGLKNADEMYCRSVKILLYKLRLDNIVSAYLDDILGLMETKSKHMLALDIDKVLEAHLEAGIKLKAKKMFLFEQAVDILGHRVSANKSFSNL